MANIQTPSTWYKTGPSYATNTSLSTLTGQQLTQLQTLLKNAGYWNGNVGDPLDLGLALSLGAFQQTGGYGNASATITTDMWYGLNVLSDVVANRRQADLGVWNTLAGARQLGYGVPDPNTWSAAPAGAIGVSPGTQQQQGQLPTGPAPVNLPSTGPTGQPMSLTSGYAALDQTLQQYGLGRGSEFDLTSWAHNWLTQPDYDPAVFQSALEQTDQFKTRFGTVNDQRQGQGLPRLTPAEILQYEQTAQGIMRAAGLPAGFYDNWRDYQSLIGGGVSPSELQQRVAVAQQWAYGLPQEVKDEFAQWFGPNSESSIAAYVLDTNRAAPLIEHQLTMAEIGGAGQRFGIGINQGTADTLANLGVDYQQAQKGFGQIDYLSPLFEESVSETQDLTKEGAGVAAVFGTEPGGQAALQRRLEERKAGLAGGGGAFVTERGVVGLGSSS